MISITIITIVVVAILTAVVFGLAWLGYSSCLKSYRAEVSQGKYDAEIYKEIYSKNKRKKAIVKAIGYAVAFMLIILLICLFVVGLTYKASGQVITINNKTVLVIKSGSMSDFYDSTLKNKYAELGYKNLQFSIGDICIFEKISTESAEFELGEVYGYINKNIIVTHRLIDIHNKLDSEGNIIATYYVFRGDNNTSNDQVLVSADKIVYHYTGKKIPLVGAFILYAQSYYGIWSLLSILGISVSSDIVLHKIHKLNKERKKEIGEIEYER